MIKPARLLTSPEFFNLLRLRNRRTAKKIDGRILARSARNLAILVSDSSGFTRRTREYGILPFLSVMTKCYDRLLPRIGRKRGLCISHNADNILAVFEDPADAVAAAVDMHRRLARHNRGKAARDRFHVCIGIHYGTVVRLADNVYGDPVNVAAKIGEDLAARDEILVTQEVAELVRKKFRITYSRSTELGGRTLELYRIVY